MLSEQRARGPREGANNPSLALTLALTLAQLESCNAIPSSFGLSCACSETGRISISFS